MLVVAAIVEDVELLSQRGLYTQLGMARGLALLVVAAIVKILSCFLSDDHSRGPLYAAGHGERGLLSSPHVEPLLLSCCPVSLVDDSFFIHDV